MEKNIEKKIGTFASKLENIFSYIKKNILKIIVINVIVTFFAPFILTRNFNIEWLNFTQTGQIGDTIGGITAPFINILNAILIYIAFTEQLNANSLLQLQITGEKDKEEARLKSIKKLIYLDLEKKILPTLSQLKTEVNIFLKNMDNGKVNTYNQHVEFNSDIYRSIHQTDLLNIFGEDLIKIIRIYNRVDFISNNTPLKISYFYPTDRNSLKLIHLNDVEYENLTKRHKEKIRITLSSLVQNPIPTCENEINYLLKFK